MKSQNANLRKTGAGRRTAPMRIPNIPMEWMDPMSWRLPSGKALAEFALQAGFLAPLMLGMPRLKKRNPAATTGKIEAMRATVEKHAGEEPEHSGRFRAGVFKADSCESGSFRADRCESVGFRTDSCEPGSFRADGCEPSGLRADGCEPGGLRADACEQR